MTAGLTPLVLDASIVVKLLVEEPGSAAAVALLDRPDQRIAPDWLAVEIAGALWNKVKYSKLLEIHAERALEASPRFLHRLHPSPPLVAKALQLGVSLHHPVYDCLYLALALAEDARLITADKGFSAAVADTALAPRVELLQWKPDRPASLPRVHGFRPAANAAKAAR